MDTLSDKKVVKMFGNKYFEIILYQGPNGSYYLGTQRGDQEMKFSERITDFKTASYLFDLKRVEMEGN